MIQKSKIKKWCEALGSGKYKQGTGQLQNGDKFCCLGVLVKELNDDGHDKEVNGELRGGTPSQEFGDPKWMGKLNSRFMHQVGPDLVSLNDSGLVLSPWMAKDPENPLKGARELPPFTFDEIADLLEAVYIHEVLGEENQ